MTLTNEVDRERRRKTDSQDRAASNETKRPRRRRGQGGEVGSALRDVYEETVQEDIPAEMLDLLGKLG